MQRPIAPCFCKPTADGVLAVHYLPFQHRSPALRLPALGDAPASFLLSGSPLTHFDIPCSQNTGSIASMKSTHAIPATCAGRSPPGPGRESGAMPVSLRFCALGASPSRTDRTSKSKELHSSLLGFYAAVHSVRTPGGLAPRLRWYYTAPSESETAKSRINPVRNPDGRSSRV